MVIKNINEKLNIEIQLSGIGYQLISPGYLELKNFKILKSEKELISVKQFEIELDFLKLFSEKIIINKLRVENPKLFEEPEQLQEASKNVEKGPTPSKPESKTITLKAFEINTLELVNFNWSTQDFKMNNLNLIITNLSVDNFEEFLLGLKTELLIKVKSVAKDEYQVTELEVKGDIENGILNLKSFNGLFFEQQFTGSLSQEISDIDHLNLLKLKLESFDLSNIKGVESLKKYPALGTLMLNLNMKYKDSNEIETVEGEISVSGKNLKIRNVDLDKLINTYKDAQKVTALDALGFYALGPVGLLYSQGANIGRSIPGAYGGESEIKNLNVDVLLKDESIHLKDVALRTPDNLLVVKGDIDLKTEEFKKLKVGFLNKKYCSDLTQKIKGTIKKPEFEVGKSLLKTLVAPVTNLIKFSKETVTGCKKFYSGKVQY